MRTVCSSGRWCGGRIPSCTGQGGVYPSMHWAGGVSSWGVSAQGGYLPRGCLPGDVCWGVVCPGGVSAQGGVCWGGCLPRGCLPGGCLPRGVSAQGRCLLGGVSAGGVCLGVFAQGGVCHTPSRCGQNDRHLWKHYLATTTLRTVNISVPNLVTPLTTGSSRNSAR